MKKRRLLGTVGTAVILLLVFICSFAAVGAAGKYVIDDAQLLTDEQEAQLSQQIQDLRQEKNIDIVIVTKNGLGEKTPQQYADDYLDQGGYGMGADENSILYLIDMESRELYLSTHGAAEDYFTPELIEEMLDHIYDQVTVQNYYGAAQAFVADAGCFDEAVANHLYDQNAHKKMSIPVKMGISVGISVCVCAIIAFSVSRGTKQAVFARDYMDQSTFELKQQSDVFLRHVVTKRKIETDNDRGPRNSNSHMSSGGESHGGGGRSF